MWVLDLEQYNEWMTEEDYEVDEGGHKKIHKVSSKMVININSSKQTLSLFIVHKY